MEKQDETANSKEGGETKSEIEHEKERKYNEYMEQQKVLMEVQSQIRDITTIIEQEKNNLMNIEQQMNGKLQLIEKILTTKQPDETSEYNESEESDSWDDYDILWDNVETPVDNKKPKPVD